MSKTTIMVLLAALLLVSSVSAVTYTNNGDGTGNYCWNNVPDAKAARIFDGFAIDYAHNYFAFNETFTVDDLTNGQKMNSVFDPVTRGFWNLHVYNTELEETLVLAREAFDASYESPMG